MTSRDTAGNGSEQRAPSDQMIRREKLFAKVSGIMKTNGLDFAIKDFTGGAPKHQTIDMVEQPNFMPAPQLKPAGHTRDKSYNPVLDISNKCDIDLNYHP